MGVKQKARDIAGGAFADRAAGERPGALRAATGAAVAGGVTGVLVYRLLRHENQD